MIKKSQMKCNATKRTPGHATKSHAAASDYGAAPNEKWSRPAPAAKRKSNKVKW